MPLLDLILIAALQGATEFLPVSSSGHLVLLPVITGGTDQGLTVDVAAHLGTLLAVLLYSRREFVSALIGLGDLLRARSATPSARLALCLLLASLPIAIAGALIKFSGLDAMLRSIAVVGWATLIFGILLYLVDRTAQESRRRSEWSLRDALIMGLWQSLALIPGSSRAGVTITGARLLGFHRHDAARLSMLMSAPAILGASLLSAPPLLANPELLRESAIVAAIAFIAALLALRVMLTLLQRYSYTPYALYRVALGIALIVISA